MCTELIHHCNYCSKTYQCDLKNKFCPTINFDKDKNLCDECRVEFEHDLHQMDQNEFEWKWNDLL